MRESQIQYGEKSLGCAKWVFAEVDVYSVPFRYALSETTFIEWVDVIFHNKSQHPIDAYPYFFYKTKPTRKLPAFSGVMLHDFKLCGIPQFESRGFRFPIKPNTLEISLVFSINAPWSAGNLLATWEVRMAGRKPLVVAKVAKEADPWYKLVNQLDVAFWDPAEPQTSTLKEAYYIANELLLLINRDPNLLKNLNPGVFERLVAEIFKRGGFNIAFTAGSSDGGVDIFAVSSSNLSSTSHLIQCKRYKGKIGVSLVRELYGVKSDAGANKAILVTTSSFTTPAIEFADRHSWEISLVDYEKLIEWIHYQFQKPTHKLLFN